LKRLASDYQIDVDRVVSELCEWAFSNSEDKQQFEAWLVDTFPPKGYVEYNRRRKKQEISETEEYARTQNEEESHEHSD
jgi:hypothetical protein